MNKFILLLVASILFAMTTNAQKLNATISGTNVTCVGGDNGSARVRASGAFPPFTYKWEPSGQTKDTATGLYAAVQYTVTVYDAIDDSTEAYIMLSTIDTMTVGTSSTEPSCFGMNNGTAAITSITGGTAPFQILWTPGGQTTDTATNLPASTYTSVVTDAAGCQVSTAVPVQQPPQLILTANSIASLAAAYASGGTAPYTYFWSPGGYTTDSITGLTPGTYTVTVNDANLCTSSAVVTVDTTIITFSFSNVWVDCREGVVNYNIMASSNVPTYFNSGVIDIKYTGPKFFGDSLWGNSLFANLNFPYYPPLQVTNLSDSVIQIVIGDTTYTPVNETLLDSVPKAIITGGFIVQSPCQPGALSFTNELYTGPTCYHTLFTKVFNYTDTVSVKTVDSLYNPHTCDSLCNPFNCNLHCCNYDANNSCTDSCYDICYNECPYTCYDTAWKYTQTVDSIFTTYSKNFQYNTAIYGSSSITIDTICPPNIQDFNAPIDAGIGNILTISGTNFGSTRGTGRVEFYDADTANYYIPNLNNEDYLAWNSNEIKIRLPSMSDSFPSPSSKPPAAIGGGNFIVINSCGNSDTSHINDTHKPFSVYYNINQSWNQILYQKDEVLLRNIDGEGGYTFHLNPISFPSGSIQRLIFAKAMRDWTCYTGMNWRIGSDTIMYYTVNSPPSYFGVNYVFFTDSLPPGSKIVGFTAVTPSFGCIDSIVVLKEAPMFFNSKINYVYDTTGTIAIGHDTEDFYGVCLHELGHYIELKHTSVDTDLMFYASGQGPTAPANRITLASGRAKSAIAGAIYSITQSANDSENCSTYRPLIPLSRNCVNTTAVKEVEQNNTFVVYPNPSNGTFTIESNINNYTLVVMNILGQRVLSRKIENEKEVIDISTVASGMYFIQEQYKNGTATQKLIITKK